MSLGDFETQKKNLQEQIATAETEAGLTLDMSEVESLNKQLETLEANKHTYEDKVGQVEAPASENQVKQINELGGTEEELVKREEVQDEKVEEVKEVLEKNAEEGVIDVALFEKVSNMKSLDEAVSLNEAEAYVDKLKEEYREVGERNMPKIKEILSSATDKDLESVLSTFKEWNGSVDQGERILRIKQVLENSKANVEGGNKTITSDMLWLAAGIADLRGGNEEFKTQLRADAKNQEDKLAEGSRFSNLKKEVEEINKIGKSKFIQAVFAPGGSWFSSEKEEDALKLAIQIGIVSSVDVKMALDDYFSDMNGQDVKVEEYLRKAKRVFGSMDSIKDYLHKAGVSEKIINQAESQIVS